MTAPARLTQPRLQHFQFYILNPAVLLRQPAGDMPRHVGAGDLAAVGQDAEALAPGPARRVSFEDNGLANQY